MKSLLHIRILVAVAAGIVAASIAAYVIVPGAGQASPGPGDAFVLQSQSTVSFSSPGRTILRLQVPQGPNYLVWVTASFVNTDKDGKPDKVTCFLNGDAASAEFEVGRAGGQGDEAEVVAVNGSISNLGFVQFFCATADPTVTVNAVRPRIEALEVASIVQAS